MKTALEVVEVYMDTMAQTTGSTVSHILRPGKSLAPLRLGFVELVDAAPLLVAADLGLFKKFGVSVQLQREVGWATIREKVMYGELEAAHALCPLPLLTSMGVGSASVSCCAGMLISNGGNAIVLSHNLWKRGVTDGASLKKDISNSRHFRKYIIATVFKYSTHAFLLRDWLKAAGVDAEHDVEIVTLPPNQMCRNLQAGTIDGFCAGEPWPSLAIDQGIGWSPANSSDILPYHPEKVLMMREAFADECRYESVAIIAALIESCYFCSQPENRVEVARFICGRRRVNCDLDVLIRCLSSRYDYGMNRIKENTGFLDFGAVGSNRSTSDQVQWIVDRLNAFGAEISDDVDDALLQRVYRNDIYDEAAALVGENVNLGSP